jgi:hypothetical protein
MDKTHRDKARMFIEKGDLKRAIRLAKTFDVTYNKEELGILDIAYETFSGKEIFYKQLGVDTSLNKQKAIKLLDRLFEDKAMKKK